ncbi:MAG: chemotaxis response regulator protein-glutamate methylesterase [Spirochaetales bacterium]|nr:chemotaxis response regulator protein-glutamate methylesterase [Spirochaetales bacterium]
MRYPGNGKINIFIIDDSAVVREILTSGLSRYGGFNVVGSALDPFIAREKIAKLNVDVITLDIELPRMDGLTFLKYLMKYHPIPVVIVSSLADRKNTASIRALELGAVDIVPKPGGPFTVGDVMERLAGSIEAAVHADFEKLKKLAGKNRETLSGTPELAAIHTTKKLIALGGSTGGTNAIELILKQFDRSFPPCVVVIHMPERFTALFAERLNGLCPVTVKEAEDGEVALSGHVYIAPGNHHLTVRSSGKDYVLKTVDGPLVHHQRPAVDVLFKSIAESVGKNAIGVLLTGMGKDGAKGLLEMRQNGAHTIAQDESTSIVFGMPKEAIAAGAVVDVLPVDRITASIYDYLTEQF